MYTAGEKEKNGKTARKRILKKAKKNSIN